MANGDTKYTAFFQSIIQLVGGRAAGAAIDALERVGGVKRGSSVVLRIDGDKITYGIAGPKVAWDEVIVLGCMNTRPQGDATTEP